MVGLKASLLKYFVVDAFTSSPLKDNLVVVLLLDEEKDQESLQAMALEFNLLTCYVTKVVKPSMTPRYNLRWFASALEVKICGHGNTACMHTIFSTEAIQANEIEFNSLSRVFLAKRILENIDNKENQINGHEIVKNDIQFENGHENFLLQLRFPLYPTTLENDLIVELMSSMDVAELKPNMDEMKNWPGRGVGITGLAPPESEFDFFTRLFSPNYGIDEDQVCGSIHCAVAPYWIKKLGKSKLKAYMASPSGGILRLNVDAETQSVLIAGEAVTVMEDSFIA